MHSISASLSDSTDVNVSTSIKRDQNCKAIDNSTGEPCGETEGLRILDEFRKLYESRIEKIDGESGGDFDRVSVSSIYFCCKKVAYMIFYSRLFVLHIYETISSNFKYSKLYIENIYCRQSYR